MGNYRYPTVKVVKVRIERGFEQSEPDMNYGDGGDAWEN